MTKRDWSAFERKLAAGKSLRVAAIECGIDESEAENYADEKRASAPVALEHNAHEAIEIGITTLRDICTGDSEVEIRAAAASALLRYGAAALKLAREGRQAAKAGNSLQVQVDLFDRGDWQLKDPAKA